MKIYVAHSTSFNFKKELYLPIRNSELNNKHQFTLPHDTDKFINSKDIIINNSDVVIAEISYQSTGLGIELGWAEHFKIPIIFINKVGNKISNSLKSLSKDNVEYSDSIDLIEKLNGVLSRM